MMKTTGRLLAVAVLLFVAAPTVAAEPPVSSDDRREALRPLWERLRDDPEHARLRATLPGHLRDRAVVERYLRSLPISPLELLRFEMDEDGVEFMIPSVVVEWHLRWIAMHPRVARAQYGDAYVDPRVAWTGDRAAPPAGASRAAAGNVNVGAAGPIFPEDYQGETRVAVDPSDPSRVVIAANTSDDLGGLCGDLGIQAVFHSADGGQSWGYTCAPDHAAFNLDYQGQTCADLGGETFGSDPALTWDDQGTVYLTYMLLCYNGGYISKTVLSRSIDGGATWQPVGIVSPRFADKHFHTIDTTPTSPYYGRQYVCWKDQSDSEGYVSRSTDGGQSWTTVRVAEIPGVVLSDYACDVEVAADGTLHWFGWSYCFNPCSGPRLLHAKSTDGGVSWSTPVEAVDLTNPGFTFPIPAQNERNITFFGEAAVDRSGGACHGTLYATLTDLPTGQVIDSDVLLVRSTDGGATWSTPLRLNDDGVENHQFNPTLAVDQADGRLVAAWYDTRGDAAGEQVDVYATESVDCGVSVAANQRITEPSAQFNNATISTSNENSIANANAYPVQYGEYMGLDLFGGVAYLAWTDSRHFFPQSTSETQRENVGFARVAFAAPTPGGAADLRVDAFDRQSGTLTLGYTPACSAPDHTIVSGPLSAVGSYGYASQACGIGASGTHAGFDPGAGSAFFVIVGNDGAGVEGSYGRDSDGAERPEDAGDPSCALAQDLSRRCD